MGYGIHGYVEFQDSDMAEWEVYTKLETGDISRGWPVQLVFGHGSTTTDCASLYEDRGLPIDATEQVREDYTEKQVRENPVTDGVYRDVFGHSYATTGELPDGLIEKFPPLAEAAAEHDIARLLVWFSR